MNTPITAFRIDPELLAELDALAASWDMTRSDILRTAVRSFLRDAEAQAVRP
jgi:predicted transcriptional regulator